MAFEQSGAFIVDELFPMRIFSLSEIASVIREQFKLSFPEEIWAKAEIAKLNVYQQSGHCYLDLVEKQSGQTKAQFRAVIWANDFSYISDKFSAVTGTEIKSGMMVLFMVRPVFHAVYGLSLQVIDVEPSYTLGEMERQRRETIGRLNKEGVFHTNKTIVFPPIPLRLAVISAPTSKGYADFLNILKHHPRRYRFQIQLFTAILQGDRAVESILTQLRLVASHKQEFDLVLIIRGGGDEIGMTCFDDYNLSRDVCLHPLPVVTGIGHSTNLTIVEMVASRNKITPTDVAYDILGMLDAALLRIEDTEKRIAQLATAVIFREKHVLTTSARALSNLMHGTIVRENIRLEQKREWLIRASAKVIQNHSGQLSKMGDDLPTLSKELIVEKLEYLHAIERQLFLQDPVNILKRGFSLTFRADGTLVTSYKEVEPGERLISQLKDGTLYSRVEVE